MFFNPFRPKPKFSVGQVVLVNHDMRLLKAAKDVLYLKIEKTVWMNPQDEKRQWGYDGSMYKQDESTVVSMGHVLGALESTLSLALQL